MRLVDTHGNSWVEEECADSLGEQMAWQRAKPRALKVVDWVSYFELNRVRRDNVTWMMRIRDDMKGQECVGASRRCNQLAFIVYFHEKTTLRHPILPSDK